MAWFYLDHDGDGVLSREARGVAGSDVVEKVGSGLTKVGLGDGQYVFVFKAPVPHTISELRTKEYMHPVQP